MLGLGGMGSAALYHLAKRGVKVCGVEQFTPGHDKGSSHGDSRMIREAYFEHPDYVPLVRRSFHLWRELEKEAEVPLLETPGVLIVGPEGGRILSGLRKSSAIHNIHLETLDRQSARARFPGFTIPEGLTAVLEPGGGFLHVEAAVRAHATLAERHGAVVIDQERVESWTSSAKGVTVVTNRRTIAADRLVVTAGPWSGTILKDLRLPLKVFKMMMLWFEEKPGPWLTSPQPAFGFELENRFFYGLPRVSPFGVKIGLHEPDEPAPDPTTIDRTLTERHFRPVQDFAERCLPMLYEQLTRHSTCMYTMTPDEHFLIDTYPGDDRVSFAAGFSGHGFKFAPVVGEILADLAISGKTALPCDFLKLGRLTHF